MNVLCEVSYVKCSMCRSEEESWSRGVTTVTQCLLKPTCVLERAKVSWIVRGAGLKKKRCIQLS